MAVIQAMANETQAPVARCEPSQQRVVGERGKARSGNDKVFAGSTAAALGPLRRGD